MSSPIGSKRNVKIYILYLMKHIGYPIDYITLNEVIMQTDYVAYLDFSEAFNELCADGLLIESGICESGEAGYEVTEKGKCVVDSLAGEVLASVLDQGLSSALRFLDFKRRKVTVSCSYGAHSGGGYDVHCTVIEKGCVLMSVSLWVDALARAQRMENQFRARPEGIYRGIMALLCGDVNYLLDR